MAAGSCVWEGKSLRAESWDVVCQSSPECNQRQKIILKLTVSFSLLLWDCVLN